MAPVYARCHIEHDVRLDIACDDEDRVLRRVEAIVIGQRIVPIEAFDLVVPTDDRLPIGVLRIERSADGFGELARRIGICAHAPFFQNDVAFGRHDLVRQDEVRHPIGFIVHAEREVFFRNTLEVGGIIV